MKLVACASIALIALLLFGCATQNEVPTASASASLTPTLAASLAPSVQPTIKPSEGGGSVTAKKGDVVAVDYVGSLDDGTVFDTSIREEAVKANLTLRPSYSPLEFEVGAGQMIAGFDAGVVGMRVGQEKTIRIPPSEAYGEKRADAIVSVPLANVPAGVKIGSKLSASNGATGTVIEVNATHVAIDFNHELAGKTLNFKIIMRKITRT